MILWGIKMWNNKKQQKFFYVKLHIYYHFKLDFKKVDQQIGGKWLIHGTKRRKDNQSEGNMFNPIFKEIVQGRKHPGSCVMTKKWIIVKTIMMKSMTK